MSHCLLSEWRRLRCSLKVPFRLRKRVRQAEADRGERPAMLSTGEREELKTLRREVEQPRRANAILKTRPRIFAAELDPTRQR